MSSPSPSITTDTQGNSGSCYNHGHALDRGPLLDSASTLRVRVEAEPRWTPGPFLEKEIEPPDLVSGVETAISVDVKISGRMFGLTLIYLFLISCPLVSYWFWF